MVRNLVRVLTKGMDPTVEEKRGSEQFFGRTRRKAGSWNLDRQRPASQRALARATAHSDASSVTHSPFHQTCSRATSGRDASGISPASPRPHPPRGPLRVVVSPFRRWRRAPGQASPRRPRERQATRFGFRTVWVPRNVLRGAAPPERRSRRPASSAPLPPQCPRAHRALLPRPGAAAAEIVVPGQKSERLPPFFSR
jgi:hypothetical protein